jgi:hypothetical protein
LVCNATSSHPDNIPEASKYIYHQGSDQDLSWGLSVTGIFMYHGVNPEGVDPFYPAIYGDINSTAEAKASIPDLDSCFSDTTSEGFMHYHTAPHCIADMEKYEN